MNFEVEGDGDFVHVIIVRRYCEFRENITRTFYYYRSFVDLSASFLCEI